MDDTDDLAGHKDRSWRQLADIERAFDEGRLDRAGWHAAVLALVEPAYLAGANPRAQSGHSGDPARWRRARGLLVEALPGDTDLLDVGCANGHLMETLPGWAAERGLHVEPFGVEISAPLAALARERLPHWADRIWHANAMDWHPPRTFGTVRTGLDYVPAAERGRYLDHLLRHVVAPGGRLIVGVFNEERELDALEARVVGLGHAVAGRAGAAHRHPALCYKAFWIDR